MKPVTLDGKVVDPGFLSVFHNFFREWIGGLFPTAGKALSNSNDGVKCGEVLSKHANHK